MVVKVIKEELKRILGHEPETSKIAIVFTETSTFIKYDGSIYFKIKNLETEDYNDIIKKLQFEQVTTE